MATAEFSVRITLKDAETVKRALQSMGDEGAAALKRFEQATQPASAGLQALDIAANKVWTSIGGLASQTGALGEVLATLGPKGIALAAGFGAIGVALTSAFAAANRTIEIFGRLADQSDQIGMSAEHFQELQYGLRTMGVSGEQTATSLGKLNSVIGEVMEKGQEASPKVVDAFHRLGIATGEVAAVGGDTTEVLKMMADGIQSLGTHAERAAAVHDLFGRTLGDKLLPFLEQGRVGIDALTEAARKNGAVVSDELAKAWDDFGDRIENARQVVESAAARALPEFGSALAKVAETTSEFARSAADVTEKVREVISAVQERLGEDNIFSQIVTAIATAEGPLTKLMQGFSALVGMVKSQGDLGKKLAAAMPDQAEAMRQREAGERALLMETGAQFGAIGITPPEPREPGPMPKPLPAPFREKERATRARAAPKEPKLDLQMGTIPMQDWLVTAEQAFSKFDQISQESLTKTQKGADDLMQRLLQANLQSHGSMVELINMRRDEDMKAINIAALNDEQKAKARALANDTASREIIQARQREINIMDSIVQANQQATGQLVASIELRRDRALAALEDELSSEEDKARMRVLINETADRQIAGDRNTIGARQQELIQGTGLGADASPLERGGAMLDAFGRKLTDISGMANGLMQGLASVGATASSAFADAIMAGDSFSDTLDKLSLSVEKMMIQLTLQMAMQAAIGGGMIGLGGLLMGGGPGAGAGAGAGGAGGAGGADFLLWGLGGSTAARKGGVFSSGEMIPFAHGGMIERSPTAFPAIWAGIPRQLWPMARGGIVSQPTVFPMARGWGLMGEAGHEAVMPLQKMPSGELRVHAVSDDPKRRGRHDSLPLTRTANGDLAVKLPISGRFQYGGVVSGGGLVALAAGDVVSRDRSAMVMRSGDNPSPQVTVNVINNAGAKVTTQEQKDQDGNLNINVLVDAIESAMAQRVQRPGGTLNKALLPALNPIKAR